MTNHRRQRARPAGPKRCFLLLLPLLLCIVSQAPAETMRLPMSIDMELLRALIVDQAYHEPGERAKVVAMGQGCNEIWLSELQVGSDRGLLRFQTAVTIHWGTPIAGNCLAPLYWEGSLALRQQPVINTRWQLRFQTLDSVLSDRFGQPAPLAGLLWNLVKDHVHTYLSTIAINLAPPVDNLKQFMLSQSIDDDTELTSRVLAGMRPDQPVLTEEALRIDLLAEVEPVAVEQPPDDTDTLSPEARIKIIELWQSWDAMLIHLIGQLSEKPLTQEDRQVLLDAMLTVRYEFNEALAADRLTNAFVRNQFVQSWRVLRPLFRRHLDTASANNMLGYLSFFTAGDALATLDRIGPLLGVEISRAGFYRLAQMVSDEALDESGALNPLLRRVLGLDEPLAIPMAPPEDDSKAPPEPDGSQRLVPPPPDSSLYHWLSVPFRLAGHLFAGVRSAHAAAPPSITELRRWTAGITPANELLPRVHQVLNRASLPQRSRLVIQDVDSDWFIGMMNATAWQESCFRQFTVKDGKIVYLLSYNNTSVGLMQINEKIWRGIYDLQELRWNIRYNSMAGAEILALYLTRYITRHTPLASLKDEAGKRYLAAWLYALYNGGPSQLEKFPARHTSGTPYRSDELFLAKYERVNSPSWLAAVDCLPAN